MTIIYLIPQGSSVHLNARKSFKTSWNALSCLSYGFNTRLKILRIIRGFYIEQYPDNNVVKLCEVFRVNFEKRTHFKSPWEICFPSCPFIDFTCTSFTGMCIVIKNRPNVMHSYLGKTIVVSIFKTENWSHLLNVLSFRWNTHYFSDNNISTCYQTCSVYVHIFNNGFYRKNFKGIQQL